MSLPRSRLSLIEGKTTPVDRLVKLLRSKLSDDLRRPPWRGANNPIAGHCYVASEALYFLLGAKKEGWKPVNVKVKGVSHWFLKHSSGLIIDSTADQFCAAVPHHKGRGRGFSTPKKSTPGKRAQTLMDRITSTEKGSKLVDKAISYAASL